MLQNPRNFLSEHFTKLLGLITVGKFRFDWTRLGWAALD